MNIADISGVALVLVGLFVYARRLYFKSMSTKEKYRQELKKLDKIIKKTTETLNSVEAQYLVTRDSQLLPLIDELRLQIILWKNAQTDAMHIYLKEYGKLP